MGKINSIDALWDELEIFLENDKDFQILQIKNDFIKIKALNPTAFHNTYIYCKILSKIVPMNGNINLVSRYILANTVEDDSIEIDLTITCRNDLYYKGQIKIVKY